MAEGLVIEPIVISTREGLDSPGDTISRTGAIGIDTFSVSGHDFALSDGLSYDVALTNTGEGILATGLVRGRATAPCDRCLEPATTELVAEVSCYYLNEEPQVDDEDDEVYGLISADGTIDLAEAIQGAVAMELPYVVLCRPDCLGLCPTCGANLNEGDCGCAERKASEPDPMSPFAALAALKLEES